jgi:hypothetical protein
MVQNFIPYYGETSFVGSLAKRKRASIWMQVPFWFAVVTLLVIGLTTDGRNEDWSLGQDISVLLGHDLQDSAGSSYFPLQRDWYSVIAILALAYTPRLIWLQWCGYEALLEHMTKRKSMLVTQGHQQFVNKEVRRANLHIRIIGRFGPLVLLFIAISMHHFLYEQQVAGVFRLLTPEGADSTRWAKDAYETWWASPTVSVFNALFYLTLGTWGLYLITMQNLVGLRVIWALWKVRNSIDFGADPINQDGYYGWSPVRDILAATYKELAIHGVALASISLMAPSNPFAGPMAVATLQWAVLLPIYVAFPFVFVRNKIKRYKLEEIKNLDGKAHNQDPSLPDHQRITVQDAYAKRIEMVRRIPTLPFKAWKDASIFLLALTADTSAVITIVNAVVSKGGA